eukprot:m.40762 g.40762  ORF g.40762 m.40762 type:complete len:195 (+) comp9706_c0_seq2:107-691(+)
MAKKEVVLEGLFNKRAQGKSGVLGRMNWRDRWFQLDVHSIKYFVPNKDENGPLLDESNSSRSALKGYIPIADITQVEEVPKEKFKRKNIVSVVYKTDAAGTLCTLYFEVKTASDVFNWINGIKTNQTIKTEASVAGDPEWGFTEDDAPQENKAATGKANPMFGHEVEDNMSARCLQCGGEVDGFDQFCSRCQDE